MNQFYINDQIPVLTSAETFATPPENAPAVFKTLYLAHVEMNPDTNQRTTTNVAAYLVPARIFNDDRYTTGENNKRLYAGIGAINAYLKGRWNGIRPQQISLSRLAVVVDHFYPGSILVAPESNKELAAAIDATYQPSSRTSINASVRPGPAVTIDAERVPA